MILECLALRRFQRDCVLVQDVPLPFICSRRAAAKDETAPTGRQAGRGPAGATRARVVLTRAHRRPPASLVSEEARPVGTEHVDDNRKAAVGLWLSRFLFRQQWDEREDLPLPPALDVSPAHVDFSLPAWVAGSRPGLRCLPLSRPLALWACGVLRVW